MTYAIASRVRDTSTTTGTGAFTLAGAPPAGFRSFASALGVGSLFTVAIVSASDWEVSLARLTSATVLERVACLSSSNSGDFVNFGAGTKDLFVTGAEHDLSRGSLHEFGDGSDGDATISGTLALSRDTFYRNLTLASGGVLQLSGYRLFVSGVLDLTAATAGALNNSGAVGNAGAATTTAGAALFNPLAGAFVHGAFPQTAGGAGGTAAGVQAAAHSANQQGAALGGQAGANGGAGGAGSSGAGGVTRAASPLQFARDLPRRFDAAFNLTPALNAFATGVAFTAAGGVPGIGGSGGGGDGTAGGGGGGPGTPGGIVWISARVIARGASTAAGAIAARGGNGGAGGTPAAGNRGGGGGASGAGGGAVYVHAGALVGSSKADAIDVSGGDGGDGGGGSGTGAAGNGGHGGRAGQALVLVGASQASTYADGRAVAGAANAGASGGAGATLGMAL